MMKLKYSRCHFENDCYFVKQGIRAGGRLLSTKYYNNSKLGGTIRLLDCFDLFTTCTAPVTRMGWLL